MRKSVSTIAIIAVLFVGWCQRNASNDIFGPLPSGNEAIAVAFREQISGVQVTGEGVVTRILPDDEEGRRHQRFILSLESGQTLLIAHNIDLAPRMIFLEPGDLIRFNGVYEWKPEGGVVHWTHHDPRGKHEAGWLKRNGETFQ